MALDILHDNWGPYTHTEVENALKAYLAVLENRINQAIQEGGVGLEDLSQEVRDLLEKANKALQPSDIAAWAKAQNKPGYTVSEITGVEGFQNLLAKLQDMDQKIHAAAQSGGVDPDDEMSNTSENAVQNKVIKAYVDAVSQRIDTLIGSGNVQGAIDTFNEVTAFLAGISSSDTLAAKLAQLQQSIPTTLAELSGDSTHRVVTDAERSTWSNKQDALVSGTNIKTINNMNLLEGGNINIEDGIGFEDASTPVSPDGTLTILLSNGNSLVLDLKHTHAGLAQLVVDSVGNLPPSAQMSAGTIYAGVQNGEVKVIYLNGYPFYGAQSANLPYDAEIEYLQSTGEQYIDTGIVGGSDFECEISAEFTQNQDGFDTLLGAFTSQGKFCVALAIQSNSNNNRPYFQFGSTYVLSNADPLGKRLYKTSLKNGVVKIDVDGVAVTDTYADYLSDLSMYLFARHRGDTTIGNYSKVKLYYCKIWKNGNLVRYFVPVRIAQVGYLYDRVSSQLFSNDGSGSFTLGNDLS